MAAPTPQTSTSIIRLSPSSTKRNGTFSNPAMVSQLNVTAAVSPRAKITPAQTKLTITADTEMAALRFRHRIVNSTIAAALTSGASSTTQGSVELIRISNWGYPGNALFEG